MIDPGSAAVAIGATNAATTLSMNAHKGVGAARRRFQLLGTFDAQWLSLRPEDAEFDGLSAKDVEDIEEFLSSRQMEPILAFYLITMLSGPGPERDQALLTFKKIFANEAQKWLADSKGKWKNQISLIQSRIEALYDGTLEQGLFESYHQQDIEGFTAFINSPVLGGAGTKSRGEQHLKRLIDLMRDVPGLVKSLETSRHLAQTISAVEHQPIITHTELDGPSDFESLYVQRNFVRDDDEQIVDAADLNPSTAPFRMVVMGHPGAGKSTFVQHFRKTVSGLDSAIPVVELVCRHYVKSFWDKSIVKHAVESIKAEHSIAISTEQFENMLLLGRVCLVFDGLDEITEQAKRAQMISRIESLVGQYPVCSVLVTSRLMGYERAPLTNSIFDHVRLDQFDDEQFDEYCTRWFGKKGRTDLVDSFIHDSESVYDLRYNPLMLSLLCALYREHGSLPTDRRDVYAKCADLLFRRWDSHRQIEHSGAMPKYAERLMQEIANWVYTSTSVQDGIEEQQLVKVLAHSLIDRDGFDSIDAERDAKSFVEFCAGRAWLLASFGTNSRGQRMFRFTHRTFLEYFAAESFARRAESQEKICDEIQSVFDRDPTSVVPELLIQAYDFHRDGGGPAVFKQILRSNARNLLLLRLMEGIGMSSQLRSQAFQSIVWGWLEHPNSISALEFEITLSLNEQARAQLVREFLVEEAGPQRDSVRAIFLDGWAGLMLSGSFFRFQEYWAPIFSSVAHSMVSRGAELESQTTVNWTISLGLRPEQHTWNGWDAVACVSIYDVVPGLVWWTIEARLGRMEELPDNPVQVDAIQEAHRKIVDGSRIPVPLLVELRSILLRNGTEYLQWDRPSSFATHALDTILLELVQYVIFAMHEAQQDVEPFVRMMKPSLSGGDLGAALTWRDFKVGLRRRPARKVERAARDVMQRQPAWLRDWCDGRRSLVLWDDEVR
ncbi:NACHT domain-containing protein [Rhodococcus sp. IEGM 27]|uniref:NACHT domain-containing protein n=1 Tax=Rhodococcus sp. IEGM 27 TaxID=3082230 RepID=UPI0029555200|nr:NACHT domain-containing protein [Rhodococcus sp. IEGM 27]MDV8030767.1 NACHT domain-containing protein [Rhodococcus sp. IEGM 27]